MIIDAHMHFSNVAAFYTAADDSGVVYSQKGYIEECKRAKIIASVCMGLNESKPHAFPDENATVPMLADLDEPPPDMYTCIGINPHRLDDDAIKRIQQTINKSIVGFKIYAGYYHFHVHDPVYDPIYRLAAEHGLTVAIHTGVTYSETGLMEYSHPLQADRAAVMYRDAKILLCHMGNPWIMDACEVAYKNRNVYLDISGLVEGNSGHIQETMDNPLLMAHYSVGLHYLNNYTKVLFGTDWPIVPLEAYIEFCRKLVPDKHHARVFYENARELYRLGV